MIEYQESNIDRGEPKKFGTCSKLENFVLALIPNYYIIKDQLLEK
jgi:hypothetical protein